MRNSLIDIILIGILGLVVGLIDRVEGQGG